jgi:hypothetical protein
MRHNNGRMGSPLRKVTGMDEADSHLSYFGAPILALLLRAVTPLLVELPIAFVHYSQSSIKIIIIPIGIK